MKIDNYGIGKISALLIVIIAFGSISGLRGIQSMALETVISRGPYEELDVLSGSNPVVLDGINSTGEWTDAGSISFMAYSSVLTIFYKHNGTDLYLAFDYNEVISVDMAFDLNNDGGSDPQTDDIMLHVSYDLMEFVGDGKGWTSTDVEGWDANVGMSRFREVGINLTKLGITAGTAQTIGACFSVSGSFGAGMWPISGDPFYPETFEDIYSSDQWKGIEPVNNPPLLLDGKVDETKGLTTSVFEYSILYSDAENDTPTLQKVVIDDVEYDMIPDGDSFIVGTVFRFSTSLDEGVHSYHFLFNDSVNSVRFPDTGEYPGPTVYLPNNPPVLADGGIPNGTFSIREDVEEGESLIDLEKYFWDDHDDGNLTFVLTYQEDPNILSAAISGRYLDIEQLKENWHGSLSFQVKAVDKGLSAFPAMLYREETKSNIFEITVVPMNDPPKIQSIGNEKIGSDSKIYLTGISGIYEDVPYSTTIQIHDIDIADGGSDEIFYSENSSFMEIIPDQEDPSTAEIRFFPANEDVGTHHINISVSDGTGEEDHVEMLLEVINTNDDPFITGVTGEDGELDIEEHMVFLTGPNSLKEDEWFNATIEVHDDDIAIGTGDRIFFYMDGTIEGFHLDPYNGKISFLPQQEYVGIFELTIWIEDIEGSDPDDFLVFRLQIENTNDPPSLPEITSETGKFEFTEGDPVYLIATGHDVDMDYDPFDYLQFTWYSDIDGEIWNGVRLNVSMLSPGVHNITLTSTDSHGESSVLSFQVTILQRESGDDDDAWTRFFGYLEIPLIVIVFLLIISTLMISGLQIYGRVKTKSILDNVNRKMIYETIKHNPGINFVRIMKKIGISQGVLSHHLNILEKNEFVRSLQDGKYRRFYLYDDRTDYKLVLSNIQQMILFIVNDDPGISQVDISKACGKNKVVINYNIRILRDVGLIALEKEGRETHCFITSTASDYLME